MILNIHGVEIKFPFEPYQLQRDYMTKVIEALNGHQNAILESPTGTGKTLCLLTASIAWMLKQKDEIMKKERMNLQKQAMDVIGNMKNSTAYSETNIGDVVQLLQNPQDNNNQRWKAPKLIYTSRTHSQLTQAVQELKNSDYRNVMSVSLGSRDQLCINKEVIKEGKTSSERSNLCQLKVKKKQCRYRDGVEKFAKSFNSDEVPVKDIEDLVTIGNKCHACPYYLSRELAIKADIIFMPYNYLLDPKILKVFKVDLDEAIIILDEAHNVEKVCEDTASIIFSSSDITNSINDLTHVMKVLDKNGEDENQFFSVGDEDGEDVEKDFTLEDCAKLKEILLKIEDTVDKIDKVSFQGRTFPGSKLFEMLSEASINYTSYPIVKKLMDNLILFLTQSSSGNLFGRKGGGLMKMVEVLETAFEGIRAKSHENYVQEMNRGYRVHIELEKEPKKRDSGWTSQPKISKNPKVVNYWCFHPGFGMSHLLEKNVRSVILTSGTLAPLQPLISELSIRIDHRLENPHIIKSNQVMVKILNNGPDKEPLNGNYDNRENKVYLKSMGMAILGLTRVIPNGVLIFFPSYPLMNKFIETWQAAGIYKSLHDIKPIFIEPRSKEDFQDSIKNYYEHTPTNQGAIYMAVLRGKVSEGLDFNDHNARAVIICGIPFPPMYDPRVILKKSYLDVNRNGVNQLQSGQDWYVLESVRAVNQAIGRVIRHKDDYGAIFLCDKRFHNQKTQLSRWIQSHLASQTPGEVNYGKVIGETARFFRSLKGTAAEPQTRVLTEVKTEKAGTSAESSSKSLYYDAISNQLKEKPNEIYSNSKQLDRSSEEYQSYIARMKKEIKSESQGGFMGSLSRDVSVIDFNSTPSTSSSNVKASRPLEKNTSQDEIDSEQANKRRRFKLKLTNANNIFGSDEDRAELKKQDSRQKLRVAKKDFNRDFPMNKNQIFALLKTESVDNVYKTFVKLLVSYKSGDLTIEEVMDSMFSLFENHPEKVGYLRVLKTLIFKPEDHDAIDQALEERVTLID